MNELPASVAEIAQSSGLHQEISTNAHETASAPPKEPTKAQLKLIKRAADIAADPLGDPVFLARFLIQCTLPHANPGNVPVWRRKNGAYTLRIQPGWDDLNDCPMGYPYGTLPRLILIWCVTEAKRTGIRRLHIGHCLTEFIEKLELHRSGGRRGDGTRLKDQARRLFSSHIAFHRYEQVKIEERNITMEQLHQTSIVENINLAWDKDTPDQPVLWGSWIDLSPQFFAAIMESVVPCDMRAVGMLRKSPLALDLYMLCNYIGANLEKRKQTKHHLTWRMLGQQLGCDYGDQHDLKRRIKAAIVKVKLAHPGLRLSFPKKGGLTIHVSRPAIPPRVKAED